MTPDALLSTLRTWGRQPASELLAKFGVSRPTLMRTVRACGDAIIARGKARRSTYAAHRALRGRVEPLALYRIDTQGQSRQIGELRLAWPAGCALDLVEPFDWPLLDPAMADGWFDGLPYPLYDARPLGFLGRHFAHEHAATFQVDDNPDRWSDDDVLHALSIFGSDTPGDLIVGETAYRRWLDALQSPAPPVTDADLSRRYAALAEQALVGGAGTSSAGGDFPKFTTTRRRRSRVPEGKISNAAIEHVIVKFSGNDDSPGTRRWADLLVCEHIASVIQRDHLGIVTAESTIHEAGGRTFLEVVRFDRHGPRGRSGVCSWLTLDAALIGSSSGAWPDTTARLVDANLLAAADHASIALQWHFGRLIGNTDMHDGNLSFLPPQAGENQLRVSPAYDMLPMLYAPSRGIELVPRAYAPQLPMPAQRASWHRAAGAALAFWHTVAADKRVSAPFRKSSRENAPTLKAAMALAASS